MQASNAPTKSAVPFANSGAKNTIPVASQIGITPGLASFTDGFPPLTMTPLAAGGVPPYGQDFNGILNFLSAAVRWAQAGGSYVYDSAFATAAGGYPRGAVLLKSGLNGIWLCTTDNNTSNPDAGGAGWVDGYAAALSVGSATTATHAIQFGQAFGLGQTWIDVTASRAAGVTYTNSTGKPIMISTSVTGSVANSTVAVALLVGSGPGLSSNSLVTNGTPGNWSLSCTGVVPPGLTYRLNVTQGTLLGWAELR